MNAQRVEKKVRLTAYESVRFQLITELVFFRKEHLIPSDIEILSLLALWGPMGLRAFCAQASRVIYASLPVEEMPTREQNIRNRMVKLAKRELVVKEKNHRKLVQLNPAFGLRREENLLLDYKFLILGTNPA
jgi:hypothetical protein